MCENTNRLPANHAFSASVTCFSGPDPLYLPLSELEAWVQAATDWTLTIVRRTEPGAGFQVLPRRWVVERTFAWRGRYRRLRQDYEGRAETTEAWIHVAMTGLMLRRLAPTPPFLHPLRGVGCWEPRSIMISWGLPAR